MKYNTQLTLSLLLLLMLDQMMMGVSSQLNFSQPTLEWSSN